MKSQNEGFEKRIYSPYVKQRETLDNGFSRGYGFYFPPSEEYWFDSHSHLGHVKNHAQLYKLLDEWFSRLDAFRLGRVLLIAPENCDPKYFNIFKDVSNQDNRFSWLVRMSYDRPDMETFKKALECNAVGLKLHNAPVMKGLAAPDIWLSDDWDRIFTLAGKEKKPVLWHVTQRISKSPYHGGGENSYWSEGWKRGVTYTNEDLVQVFLKILEKYPGISLIGAHQLYVGLERLESLLDNYKNMYIDTSCGFYLRWADTLYDEDKEILREFFIKYQEQILFGSDSILEPGGIDEYLVQGFLCHARFISTLRLPCDVLQKVAHENVEQLFGLSPIEAVRRGNVRP